MQINTFHELYIHKIQSIYDAENQIIEAMPTLIDLASSQKLKDLFSKHLEETEKQKGKLEKLCDDMNIELENTSNLAMEGMIDENMELLQDNKPSAILDAALIAAAQAIEHYEISAYGTAAEWAKQMEHTEAQKVLAEIMEEEINTDKLLTQIAQEDINQNADKKSGQATIGRQA